MSALASCILTFRQGVNIPVNKRAKVTLQRQFWTSTPQRNRPICGFNSKTPPAESGDTTDVALVSRHVPRRARFLAGSCFPGPGGYGPPLPNSQLDFCRPCDYRCGAELRQSGSQRGGCRSSLRRCLDRLYIHLAEPHLWIDTRFSALSRYLVEACSFHTASPRLTRKREFFWLVASTRHISCEALAVPGRRKRPV